MVINVMQLLLVAIAWSRGWKIYALLPLAVAILFWFSLNSVRYLANVDISSWDFVSLVWLTALCLTTRKVPPSNAKSRVNGIERKAAGMMQKANALVSRFSPKLSKKANGLLGKVSRFNGKSTAVDAGPKLVKATSTRTQSRKRTSRQPAS